MRQLRVARPAQAGRVGGVVLAAIVGIAAWLSVRPAQAQESGSEPGAKASWTQTLGLDTSLRGAYWSSDRDLNDNREVFRSRLLLDRDRSIRGADLAAVYTEAGLDERGRLQASRAVEDSYANFSSHLFLARTLAAQEDPNNYNLRYETAQQSELLVANLLAPIGGGNLSQFLSLQDNLRYFGPRPFGVSSLTQYGSRGDWTETASLFGTMDGFSYAFDTQYLSANGQRANNDQQQKQFVLTAKQQLTPADSVYFQVGRLNSDSGDLAQYDNQSQANHSLRANETPLWCLLAFIHSSKHGGPRED